MSYKITILKAEVVKQPKGYSVAEIAYKTDDGKTKGMKVLDFVQKDVFAVVKDLKPGDICDADFEKNTKGFWQFANVVNTGSKGDTSVPATPQTSTGSKGGNWETSTERSARQVMIVRQSSLSNAINYFNLTGHKKAEPEEVINVAKVFEDFVMGVSGDGDERPTGEVT